MLKRILPALILTFIVSSLACAQGPECTTFSLSGALVIPFRDHPEKFEVLILSRMGEQLIAHSYVDLTNHFYFDALPGGSYDVVVRLAGYKELRDRIELEQRSVSSGCTIRRISWLEPEDTAVVADERLRGYPKAAIDEFVLAMEADADKRYEEVVKHLESVVKLAADWFDAHCELGAAYEEIHRDSDAETEYRRALELKPDSFRALMSLGRLLVAQADEMLQEPATRADAEPIFRKARDPLVSAFMRDPMSGMAAYMLGNVDFRLASYKDAENELKRALELDESIYPARISLINVYIMQKKWEDALENVDAFIIQNPASPHRAEVMATRLGISRRLAQTP